MKKLLLLIYLLSIGCVNANGGEKLVKKVETILTNDRKKVVKTYTYHYAKNNFVDKIEILIITSYGKEGEGLIKMFNKQEILYVYNEQNQIINEAKYNYIGKERKELFCIDYQYDNLGYVIASTFYDGTAPKPRTYFYNEQCVLERVYREMKSINYKVTFNYKYSDKKINEIKVVSGEDILKTTTFKSDDKQNPECLLYPQKYTQALPSRFPVNNILEKIELGKKFNHKTISKIDYRGNYPKKISSNHFVKGKSEKRITIEYFFE